MTKQYELIVRQANVIKDAMLLIEFLKRDKEELMEEIEELKHERLNRLL